MTYDEIVAAVIRGVNIRDLPLRVTYYCRVSTDSDVQLNSLDNQLNAYRKMIKSVPKWTFVEGYYDEGITGTVVTKRDDFKRMLNDAKKNMFDLIVTKEDSRFARDLEDGIHCTRMLKDNGVGILFETQGLNTFDPNSEMVLNMLFNISQDFSKKLSGRVKFGQRQAMESGHVLGSSNITGYKKDKCKLVIVEEEAKFVRIVFELYATGEYGFYKLAKKLSEMGYLNKKGKIYDKGTLTHIIKNPKYKGYYRAHVHEIMDYRTKKRKTLPKEEQIIHKCEDGSIPAIVSEELWDKANDVLTTRTVSYQDNNYWSGGLKYPFSSKIYCKDCNVNFQRSHGSRKKNRPTWSCGEYLRYRLDSCASSIIAEVDLYSILKSIMDNIVPNKQAIVDSMLTLYDNIDKTNQYDKDLSSIDRDIKVVEDKKALAFDMVYKGEITRDALKGQFEAFDQELGRLLKKKQDIIKQIDILNQSNDNIDKMSNSIQEEINGGSIEEFVRRFVDEIIVSKIDDNRYNIKLDIYLNLFGTERKHTKGAKHINGPLEKDILYMENQVCTTVENVRTCNTPNQFTYNVYVETL